MSSGSQNLATDLLTNQVSANGPLPSAVGTNKLSPLEIQIQALPTNRGTVEVRSLTATFGLQLMPGDTAVISLCDPARIVLAFDNPGVDAIRYVYSIRPNVN
jgi:hypothetical protein